MTATLEQRVTSLENRMDEQERLRAGQDRDLADIAESFRKQDRLLQAFAKTQSEHTGKLDQHTESLVEIKGGIRKIVGMLDVLMAREDER